MRLIDAEDIKLHLRYWIVECEQALDHDSAENFRDCIDLIDDIPTIDAVPVVRCRECKYWTEDAEWCREFSFFITPSGEPCSPAESMDWRSFQADDFCSYGVRKETE